MISNGFLLVWTCKNCLAKEKSREVHGIARHLIFLYTSGLEKQQNDVAIFTAHVLRMTSGAETLICWAIATIFRLLNWFTDGVFYCNNFSCTDVDKVRSVFSDV